MIRHTGIGAVGVIAALRVAVAAERKAWDMDRSAGAVGLVGIRREADLGSLWVIWRDADAQYGADEYPCVLLSRRWPGDDALVGRLDEQDRRGFESAMEDAQVWIRTIVDESSMPGGEG